MKRLLLLTVFAILTSLTTMAQDEIVLECSYSSNQSYKTLLVLNSSGGEAVSVAGEKKCHYDLSFKPMGDHIIILANNASLEGWVDDIYIISVLSEDESRCFVVSPAMSDGNNFAKLKVDRINDSAEIAAKKREYGLLGGSGGFGSGKSSGK